MHCILAAHTQRQAEIGLEMVALMALKMLSVDDDHEDDDDNKEGGRGREECMDGWITLKIVVVMIRR